MKWRRRDWRMRAVRVWTLITHIRKEKRKNPSVFRKSFATKIEGKKK